MECNSASQTCLCGIKPIVSSFFRQIEMTSRSLINRLTKEIEGEFLSDNFSRGRYSTDASIYQLMPVGVVVPKSINDVEATIKIAREEGLPVLPRG